MYAEFKIPFKILDYLSVFLTLRFGCQTPVNIKSNLVNIFTYSRMTSACLIETSALHATFFNDFLSSMKVGLYYDIYFKHCHSQRIPQQLYNIMQLQGLFKGTIRLTCPPRNCTVLDYLHKRKMIQNIIHRYSVHISIHSYM